MLILNIPLNLDLNENKQSEIKMATRRAAKQKKVTSGEISHRTVCIRNGVEVPCPKKKKKGATE